MQGNKGFLRQNISIFIAILASMLIAFGGFLLFKDSTVTGSSILTSDLVDQTDSGFSFKKPKQWEKVETNDQSVDVVYSEGGVDLNESNQGMLLSSENIDVNYNELLDSQKEIISESILEQYSDPKSLENETCQEISNISSNQKEQNGYDTAFIIEATCEKHSGRNLQATFKILIGIKGEQMQITGIVAINQTWEKSGEALNAILDSVQPAS